MRLVALLLISALASCGGQPALANAPHPDPAAVAGIAAAAAAAMTLADPNAATRKPEKKQEEEKRPVEVKETVPAGVLDRLDDNASAGSGSGSTSPPTLKPPAVKRSGPPPKLPSPREAVDPSADRD